MLSRLLRLILLPPLLIAVTALVIIGLIDFDLLVRIIPKLIVAIIIVGVPILIMKSLLFPK
jgi:hypothetical protein